MSRHAPRLVDYPDDAVTFACEKCGFEKAFTKIQLMEAHGDLTTLSELRLRIAVLCEAIKILGRCEIRYRKLS